MKINDKGVKFKAKKLGGDTLAELDAERKKKGVVDTNDTSQKFFAAADVTVALQTGKDIWYPGSMSILNHKVTAYAQYENPYADVSTVIEMVAPGKLAKMPKEEQKEWKRFEKELRKHELEHHAEGLKVATEMVEQLRGIAVMIQTDTVRKADMDKAAEKALNKEILAIFGGSAIQDRVNAAMKALDKRTNHGGVVLKYKK